VTATPEDTEVLPDWLMSSITKEETENQEEDETIEVGETELVPIEEDSNTPTIQDSTPTPAKVKKTPRKPKTKTEKKEESTEVISPVSSTSESLPSWLQ
jgi:hypothetical protein